MKNLALFLFLFVSLSMHGQHFRLDSMVFWRTPSRMDSSIFSNPPLQKTTSIYRYVTDRDFTKIQSTTTFGNESDTWTTTYKDSLPVLIIGENDRTIIKNEYDSLGRMVSSHWSNTPGSFSVRTKSYWRDTDQLTAEAHFGIVNHDTSRISWIQKNYNDEGQIISSLSWSRDMNGYTHEGSAVMEYDGEFICITDQKMYNEGDEWIHYLNEKVTFPDIHYGDTIRTRFCEWSLDMPTKDSSCCTKYQWGKPGGPTNWGYITYRLGKIYGMYMLHELTEHGYVNKVYVIKNGRDPNQWREDLKTQFELAAITWVTINENNLPAMEESFDKNSDLQYRKEYYYKEIPIHSHSPEPIVQLDQCPVIYTLDPSLVYYDMLGKRVTDITATQYLLEFSEGESHQVLFIWY